MRVLIVEYDIIIAMHLAMLVAEFGHEVVGNVRSAPEAIAQAMALRPDVALMDIRLADGSGVDVACELHTHQDLRCIFISASLDESTRTALVPYEPIDFVGKPIVPVVLAAGAWESPGSD